jgi:hypothetical protein
MNRDRWYRGCLMSQDQWCRGCRYGCQSGLQRRHGRRCYGRGGWQYRELMNQDQCCRGWSTNRGQCCRGCLMTQGQCCQWCCHILTCLPVRSPAPIRPSLLRSRGLAVPCVVDEPRPVLPWVFDDPRPVLPVVLPYPEVPWLPVRSPAPIRPSLLRSRGLAVPCVVEC